MTRSITKKGESFGAKPQKKVAVAEEKLSKGSQELAGWLLRY
jgi:hypothetical protein